MKEFIILITLNKTYKESKIKVKEGSQEKINFYITTPAENESEALLKATATARHYIIKNKSTAEIEKAEIIEQ